MQVCNCFFTAVTIMLLRFLVFIVCFFFLILSWTSNFCFESAFVLLFNKFLEIFLFFFCCLNVCDFFLLLFDRVCVVVRLQSHFPHASTDSDFCFTCLLVMLALFFFFFRRCVCVYVFVFPFLLLFSSCFVGGWGRFLKKLFQIIMYVFVKSEIIPDHCTLAGVQRGRKGAKLISFQITNG